MTASLAPLPRLSPAPFNRAASAPPMATLPLPAAMFPEAVPAASSPLPPWPSPAPVFTAVPETPNVAIIRSEEQHSPVEILHSEDLDFTDSDLMEAFGPIVDHAVRAAMHAKENGIDTYLEPMLRATIRRALAESSPGSRPFNPPGAVDRLVWHLQALFTSRTYEDIFFEKTHRFQVGEVFLVDASTLALVSFASCDPARHASPRRVESSVQRLALQLRDDSGNIRETFELPDQRNVITRTGRFVTLLAVVRGRPTDIVIADLEFALRRIEDRFHEQFQQQGSALLHTLQPFLEDCLLIQAPASAA